jgi:hypothetical protein
MAIRSKTNFILDYNPRMVVEWATRINNNMSYAPLDNCIDLQLSTSYGLTSSRGGETVDFLL